MTGSLSAIVLVAAVVGFVAGWIVLTLTTVAALKSRCGELQSANSDLTERERGTHADRSVASAVQARLEAEVAAAREERAAGAEREAALHRQLAAAMTAHATAEQIVADIKTARAEADSKFAEVANKVIADARASLLEATSEKVKTEGEAARAEAQAKLAEISAGLTARLGELGTALAAMQTAREQDTQKIAGELGALGQKAAALSEAIAMTHTATNRVSTLLSTRQARGAWGEYELKRLIEMTGMTEHVSFDVQKAGYGDDERGRPDVVLYIAGGGTLPIDAKVPFDAYQEAVEATDEGVRTTRLADAVSAVRGQVKTLAQRRYHSTPGCIGWTIMFVPIESMLSSVLASDSGILQYAIENRVLIASPLSLLVYLFAFAQGWSYASQQENAQQILEQAKQMVGRLAPFVEHLTKVGGAIQSASDAYNRAVGSFDRSVAPQARRIYELGGADELPPLVAKPVEVRLLDPDKYVLEQQRLLPEEPALSADAATETAATASADEAADRRADRLGNDAGAVDADTLFAVRTTAPQTVT